MKSIYKSKYMLSKPFEVIVAGKSYSFQQSNVEEMSIDSVISHVEFTCEYYIKQWNFTYNKIYAQESLFVAIQLRMNLIKKRYCHD